MFEIRSQVGRVHPNGRQAQIWCLVVTGHHHYHQHRSVFMRDGLQSEAVLVVAYCPDASCSGMYNAISGLGGSRVSWIAVPTFALRIAATLPYWIHLVHEYVTPSPCARACCLEVADKNPRARYTTPSSGVKAGTAKLQVTQLPDARSLKLVFASRIGNSQVSGLIANGCLYE
ncbi:hypothetical protein WG66_013426 [Moniliophthora roreri]|nr:hypothetical protein WG66_013426 [Moniliophthora roreri]